jgi:flagellar motor switch/type III secretory pathway protein FliN
MTGSARWVRAEFWQVENLRPLNMSGIDPNYPLVAGHAAAAPRAMVGDDYELAQQLAQLPAYARSLLRIEVPVVVTLATTRHPVSRVLDLAPGTILHFGKACDDPLTLSVGRCDVAVGETVKVGDKFGLRLTSMVMPSEKFEPVTPKTSS